MIFTHNFGNGKERTIFMSYNLRTDIKNTLGVFSSMHTVFVCVVSQQWKESKYVILPSAKTSQVAWRAFLLLVWLWAPWWQISALSKGSRCDSGQDSMLVILKSNLFFFFFFISAISLCYGMSDSGCCLAERVTLTLRWNFLTVCALKIPRLFPDFIISLVPLVLNTAT